MVVALVARLAGRVERDVGHHPALDELRLAEVPDELGPLIGAELVRERDADFPGDLAVHAALGGLDPVPQLGSVMDPIRRVDPGRGSPCARRRRAPRSRR